MARWRPLVLRWWVSWNILPPQVPGGWLRRTVPFLCCAPPTAFCTGAAGRSPSVQGELTAKGAVRTAGGGRGGAPAVREEKAALLHVHRFRKGLQGLLGFFFPFSVMPAGESVPQARQDT